MEKEISILLVEDNSGDVVLTLTALKKANVQNEVIVVSDGEKAIQYLQKEGVYKDAITPDIILLDINLPRMNGLEVLTFIKAQENLRQIPVVMLTSSNAHRDVLDSYYNYASCYITKPVDFLKFMETITTFNNFWIKIVQLPNEKQYGS